MNENKKPEYLKIIEDFQEDSSDDENEKGLTETFTPNNNTENSILKIKTVDHSKEFLEKEKKISNEATVTIALPGSILDPHQSKDKLTHFISTLSRTLCIFRVDEIVVYSETGNVVIPEVKENTEENSQKQTENDIHIFFCNLLQYFETPQYLRKDLFKSHPDFEFTEETFPVDSNHHLKPSEQSLVREGISLGENMCYIGFKKQCEIDKFLEKGTRVTIEISDESPKIFKGRAVPSNYPKVKFGKYWGYSVRLAKKISDVWRECPYETGYDYTIGTSEKGFDVDKTNFNLPQFKHLLIFFGGPEGYKASIEADETLSEKREPYMFNAYLNVCPAQGTKSLRTEEAVMITLARFQKFIQNNVAPKKRNFAKRIVVPFEK